jgi:hypothetical protein
MNVVIVRGRVAGDISWFETRAGVRIAGFDLSVHTADGRDVVPVSWSDPPSWAGDITADDVLVVRGRVRKRFARSAAGPRPFTDVMAVEVVKGTRRAAVFKLLNAAADELAAP